MKIDDFDTSKSVTGKIVPKYLPKPKAPIKKKNELAYLYKDIAKTDWAKTIFFAEFKKNKRWLHTNKNIHSEIEAT